MKPTPSERRNCANYTAEKFPSVSHFALKQESFRVRETSIAATECTRLWLVPNLQYWLARTESSKGCIQVSQKQATH
jgi:hypothetical protein